MKDWGTYRKLFDHPTPSFERLPFMTRAVGAELIRRGDRLGRLVPGDKVSPALIADLAFHVRAHPEEYPAIRQAVEGLLADGYLAFADGYLVIRNFAEAQRSESRDRVRKHRAGNAGNGAPDSNASNGSNAGNVTSVTSCERDETRRDESKSPLGPPSRGEAPEPSKPEAKPKRRAPKVPLPEDWRPNDQHRAKANELGVSLSVELEKFRNHALGKDTRWADWDRAFANWLANAAVIAPRGPGGPPGAGLTPADREQAERDGKLIGEIRAGAWGDRAARWLTHAEHRGQVNLRQFREWIDHGKVRREVPPPKARDSPPAEVIQLAAGIGGRIT